jgi:hypothetical protein
MLIRTLNNKRIHLTLEIIDLNFATIKGLLECCYLRLETSILRIDLRLGLCFLVIVFSLLETKVFMMNGK